MRNRLLTLGILFLLVFSTVIPMSLGENVKISDTIEQPSTLGRGKTLYVGGSGEGNYTTIQSAIDDASDEDTVFVFNDSSPYFENVIVDKSINLVGEDRNTTVIDGSGIVNVIRVSHRYVTISGLTIQNSGSEYWWEAGIYLFHNMNITGNNVNSNNIGIYGSDGIGYSIISDNIISNNKGSGIYSGLLYNCTIIGNNIISNEEGINLDMFCFSNNITGNNISSNNDYGIKLYLMSTANTITGNIINSNNGYGISISESDGNSITNNNIMSNYLGISCRGNDNIIEKNNFIGNERQASFSSAWKNKNNWDANYWDNWKGYGPKLIFGRIGFFGLPWINVDWNPAQEPYDIGA